jgi:hypothetical protein
MTLPVRHLDTGETRKASMTWFLRKAVRLVVVVLVAAIVSTGCTRGAEDELESYLSDQAESAFARFIERWPTVAARSATLDALLSDAKGEICEDPERCHVLWANETRPNSDDTWIKRFALIAEPGDDGTAVRITSVTKTDREELGDVGTEMRTEGPRTVPVDIPTVSLAVIEHGVYHGYLFPAGAQNVKELRYSEAAKGLVEEDIDLRYNRSDHSDREVGSGRVWWIDYDWWGANAAFIAGPIIRYELGLETVYRISRDQRVCIGRRTGSCVKTHFPSEGVLVSLGTVWGQHDVDLSGEDTMSLNDDIRIDGTLGGLFPEGTTTSTGGVAILNDVENSGTHRSERSAYAIYFEDGYPAVLSAHQSVDEREVRGRFEKPFAAAALFGNPATWWTMVEVEASVPIAFHLSGIPPLVAPGLETVIQEKNFTIYQPVEPKDWRQTTFTHLEEDGRPVVTQWLVDNVIRP